MSLRLTAVILLTATLVVGSARAQNRGPAQIKPVKLTEIGNIAVSTSLISADTCIVAHHDEITTRIDGWLIGFELYKSLLDPSLTCPNAYPFTVTAVNMPMIFDASTSMLVSVDVEAVDSTTIPGCPIPGDLLAISQDWEITVPSPGLWNIWIPLDSPIVVNGPFFAGFYIGSQVDPASGAAPLTDDYPVSCATYNIWDESIGWIDLTDNDYFNFPGRLAFEAAGIPGGSEPAVDPELVVLNPQASDLLFGQTELWAYDAAQSGQVDYVIFEYSTGGAFTEIGRDFDGTTPLRDGVNPAVSGTGFSLKWDFSLMGEGDYMLRFTAVDSAGDTTSQTVNVTLEPTPPLPTITNLSEDEPFCVPTTVNVNCNDENLSYVELNWEPASDDYSIGITPVPQSALGDTDSNLFDGNPASEGEFGDYFSAPAAALAMIKLWYDRGFVSLMQDNLATMTSVEVGEQLGTEFKTRENMGSYDEMVIAGLRAYTESKGGGFEVEYIRNPRYSDLRRKTERDQQTVMLALGNSPGVWVAVDGFNGWALSDSTYVVTIANPFTGNLHQATFRRHEGISQLAFAGSWQKIELMVSMTATSWTVNHTVVGVDFQSADGWSVNWTGNSLTDETWHYVTAAGRDINLYRGETTVLAEHNCAAVLMPGDFNNDRVVDILDLNQLIGFIALGGEAPIGGGVRADVNCDNLVNVTDIIYYMNYLYGSASPPCR